MTSHIERSLRVFMDANWNRKSPLLLAFSGGPDSLALLHLLLDYFKNEHLNSGAYLALAHVDHGWRVESSQEKQEIEQIAANFGLKLHTKVLNPSHYKGNLEEACRIERLNFFSSLCDQHGYKAVFVAQHADDQAETVLKRVFEGAALYNIGSMRQVSLYEGTVLWRPLLSVTKKHLLEWLQEKELVGFDDYTNRDPKFLRGKLRVNILPELARAFGKQVSSNLVNLGLEAAEFRSYLEQKTASFALQIQQSRLGVWLDFNQDKALLPMEVNFLVRKCCELQKVTLSRSNLHKAVELLMEKRANKALSVGNREVYIDRGHLFLLNKVDEIMPPQKLLLRPGSYSFGSWLVKVSQVSENANFFRPSSWHHLWSEKGNVLLPKGEYYLGLPEKQASIDKLWTNEKVPAFLRVRVPVIYAKNRIVHEFLSGRTSYQRPEKEQASLKIELWKK